MIEQPTTSTTGITPSSTLAVYFEVTHSGQTPLPAHKRRFLQFVTQYQHPSGQFRLRATTICGAWHRFVCDTLCTYTYIYVLLIVILTSVVDITVVQWNSQWLTVYSFTVISSILVVTVVVVLKQDVTVVVCT
jgi:hypothetical protein